MVTCPSCQGSIEEGSAACIHCGHIIKRRGWWRRFLDVFAGEKPAAGHAEAGTTHPSGQPSAMMSEQEEQSWQHLGAAQNLGYQGNMAEAIAEYTIAISLNPNSAAFTGRAMVYGEMGQHDKALADLNEAVRLDPESAATYSNRSLTYTRLGMDTEAEEDIKRAEDLVDDASELRDLIEETKGQRPDKTT